MSPAQPGAGKRQADLVNKSFHFLYIAGSLLSTMVAALGIWTESPVFYGIVPGLIGGSMAAVAAGRFFKDKTDLVGLTATVIGFVYYQAYQANPVMLPAFTASLGSIEIQDQLTGVIFGNLTTALLLLAYWIVAAIFRKPLDRTVSALHGMPRLTGERTIVWGFGVVFTLVAIPNVLFGGVVVGAIRNILYQRLTWSDAETYSGFAVWGGDLGGSVNHISLWASSLFLLWLYLLRSPQRKVKMTMYVLAPLILLWTASVALQGSRTYLVSMGIATGIYVLGAPRFGRKALLHVAWAMPVLFLLIQISTLFRGEGLGAVTISGLAEHILEIQGNEGTPSQIDGFEYFRTELVAKEAAPNPFVGLVRGLLERPVEGLLMPVPRSLFPWKFEDQSGHEFNLFFQNVRLGVRSEEAFLGASPGLIGRELIKYGLFGPITLLFWLGLALAFANRVYEAAGASDFHRLFAAVLIAFVFAQARDFSPVWFIPFLPAGVVCALVIRQAAKIPRRHSSRVGRAEGRPVSQSAGD
jgi:hypothetical protein